MSVSTNSITGGRQRDRLGLARVLLVHGDLASRLSLKTILEAGGYSVDVAGTPEEARSKLDENQYELVLSHAKFGTQSVGRNLLAYARVKANRPATALITDSHATGLRQKARSRQQMSIRMEEVPDLLGRVAELIGLRASRRYRPARMLV